MDARRITRKSVTLDRDIQKLRVFRMRDHANAHYKDRKGYVIIVNGGKSKGHTWALESHNPEVAAEAALESWEEHRDNPDGICKARSLLSH